MLKVAVKTTKAHPSLWFLGLFLFGGFNFTFLVFQSFGFGRRYWTGWLNFLFYSHSAFWPVLLAGLFFVFFAVNWAKVWFVLSACEILGLKALRRPVILDFAAKNANLANPGQTDPKSARRSLGESLFRLRSVLGISLITTLGMAISSAVLFLPPLAFEPDFGPRRALTTLAVVIFLFLSFLLFCLNVFASFAAVLYQMSFAAALNLATALLRHYWQAILGLVVLLVSGLIFGAALTLSLAVLMKWALWGLSGMFYSLGFSQISAIMFLVWIVFGSGVWLILGFFNAVLNLAMLLLFDELVNLKRLPRVTALENISASA